MMSIFVMIEFLVVRTGAGCAVGHNFDVITGEVVRGSAAGVRSWRFIAVGAAMSIPVGLVMALVFQEV